MAKRKDPRIAAGWASVGGKLVPPTVANRLAGKGSSKLSPTVRNRRAAAALKGGDFNRKHPRKFRKK